MKKVIFKHIKNTKNIGDRSCSPFYYLNIKNSIAIDLNEESPPCDAIIYGGGKIFSRIARSARNNERQAKIKIAWGISTIDYSPFSLPYLKSKFHLDLIGSRDYGDNRFTYAPCPSCLSELFDGAHKEINEISFFGHAEKCIEQDIKIPKNIPFLDNHAESMRDVIDFIGSTHILVTNSYHGTYWGLLLGKKVLTIPFNEKFMHYRIKPGYSNNNTWLNDIKKAQSASEMLAICREDTNNFKKIVLERIYGN